MRKYLNPNWEVFTINPKNPSDNIRINYRIRAREVRVIADDGAQLGIMDTRKALELAQSKNLDLAEISPNSNPPVCKILDYGKYKYELKKKAKQAKKNQVVTLLKEVQFRPQTDTHDIEFKVKHTLRFLEEGHKVKISIRFRGREASHADIGHALLKQIIEMVGSAGVIEQNPKMEGKVLSMIFAASKTGAKPKPAVTKPKEGPETAAPAPKDKPAPMGLKGPSGG